MKASRKKCQSRSRRTIEEMAGMDGSQLEELKKINKPDSVQAFLNSGLDVGPVVLTPMQIIQISCGFPPLRANLQAMFRSVAEDFPLGIVGKKCGKK